MKGTDGLFKFYRPIPQAEIENNNAISASDQNEGYRSADGGSSEKSDDSSNG